MKRRLKLTITKIRRQVMAMPQAVMFMHCLTCEREVEMLTMTQAAGILNVGEQTLHDLIAAGQVHALHTVSGNSHVCKDSLFSNS